MKKPTDDDWRARFAALGAPGECWPMTGGTSGSGYPVLKRHGRMRFAHRYSYELFVGPIPAGLEIDHLCRNRRCVNPTHLEPVTRSENIRRAWQHRKAVTL